ncbi:unnamed protein product [Lasius platythorax]|uniref:Uncharacterized protein n=1 Tax=Lasius platythorax TaxID=488582 RepID=A0AAV2NN94_9HYME
MPTRAKEAARFEALRTRLYRLTEEQLRSEAATLELSTEGSHQRILDRVLDHYVRNTSLREMGTLPQKRA